MVRSFEVEFFRSLRYRIISSANRDILAVCLPIYIPFISSSCLIVLVRNSNTMLNTVEIVGTLVSFLILREIVSVFHHEV
jgi:hypothetical protein